jgi:hypothetical protein
MDARAGNDRIAEKAKRLHFLSRVPMLCECSAPGCRAIVMISLDEFAEIRRKPDTFLAAPGPADGGTKLERETRATRFAVAPGATPTATAVRRRGRFAVSSDAFVKELRARTQELESLLDAYGDQLRRMRQRNRELEQEISSFEGELDGLRQWLAGGLGESTD